MVRAFLKERRDKRSEMSKGNECRSIEKNIDTQKRGGYV